MTQNSNNSNDVSVPYLLISDGQATSFKVGLEENESVFAGSGPNCRISIDDDQVASIHCMFWLEDDGSTRVRDWNTGKTLLNGEPIEDEIELHAGDKLELGAHSIHVVLTEETFADPQSFSEPQLEPETSSVADPTLETAPQLETEPQLEAEPQPEAETTAIETPETKELNVGLPPEPQDESHSSADVTASIEDVLSELEENTTSDTETQLEETTAATTIEPLVSIEPIASVDCDEFASFTDIDDSDPF